jgi:hypothetical protein
MKLVILAAVMLMLFFWVMTYGLIQGVHFKKQPKFHFVVLL